MSEAQSNDIEAIRHTLMTGLAHNPAIAALDRLAAAMNPGREFKRISEVPSTDAHETVSAMYRALSRGHEREAQALARYYLHANLKPWEVPGPDQPNAPLPRDLTEPHSTGQTDLAEPT